MPHRAVLVTLVATAGAALIMAIPPDPQGDAGAITTVTGVEASDTLPADPTAPSVARWGSGSTGPPDHVAASPRPVHADLTPDGQHRGHRAQPDEHRDEQQEQRREHHEGPVSPEGFQVAGGSSRAGDGPTVTFTVELHDDVDEDISEVVEIAEAALYDPRSWVHDHTLERVDDPELADIRIVLAAPERVDALCAEAGLRTGGIYSCWNGRFAALNSLRWTEGSFRFGDDVEAYRTYLVNHEFGHGLGYGHVGCPAAGALAPLMMQQSKGTDGCEPNGWPYPEASAPSED